MIESGYRPGALPERPVSRRRQTVGGGQRFIVGRTQRVEQR